MLDLSACRLCLTCRWIARILPLVCVTLCLRLPTWAWALISDLLVAIIVVWVRAVSTPSLDCVDLRVNRVSP